MDLKMITNKRDVRDSLVAIRPLPIESVTKSGIVVDCIHAGERIRGDQPSKGQIVSVPEIFSGTMPRGAYVLYTDLAGGYFVPVDGVELFFTKPGNIFMVIDSPESVDVPIYGVSG